MNIVNFMQYLLWALPPHFVAFLWLLTSLAKTACSWAPSLHRMGASRFSTAPSLGLATRHSRQSLTATRNGMIFRIWHFHGLRHLMKMEWWTLGMYVCHCVYVRVHVDLNAPLQMHISRLQIHCSTQLLYFLYLPKGFIKWSKSLLSRLYMIQVLN